MPGQARLSLVRQSPLIHGRFSFQDEAGGSSPPRPTTSPDQRKCWPGCLEFAWRGVCRITNSYLVTVARHEPGDHEPPGCPRDRTSGCEPPAFALVYLPLCSCRSAKVCRTALGHAQQPPPPCPPGCGSEHQVVDLMKRWPSSGPMGSRRSTKHCSPHMVQGVHQPATAGLPREPRRAVGRSSWAASGEGCRQTGFGPTYPPRRARSRRSLPEAALTG